MKIVYILLGVIILGLVILAGVNATKETDSNMEYSQNDSSIESVAATESNCVSESCLAVDDLEYPVDTLPAEVVDALNKAIDDEYKAHATYEAVIAKLGSIRPFSMIIRAEEQHISSLKALYDKYGLPIPADPYSSVSVADTKVENCSVGVQAEIDNAALYREELLPAATNYEDITSVFTKLMNASQDNHLPAFEKCAS